MNWPFSFEVPLWAALASGVAVVLTRLAAIQVSWARLQAFGDPAVMGFRRRRLRECLLTVLLGCGLALTVAVFLPDAPQGDRSAGVTVMIFDAEGWLARQTPFDARYTMAELMVRRASELLGGNSSTDIAAVVYGTSDGTRVPPTRDIPGLLERIRALLVVQTTPGLREDSSNLATAIGRVRTQAGTRGRICVITPRPPEEVSGELTVEGVPGEIFIAGVPGNDGVRGYRSLAGNQTGYRPIGEEELARVLSAPIKDLASEPHDLPRRPQILAALALVTLLCEWIVRTGGRKPRTSHVP